MAVDMLGNLLAVYIAPANEQERVQVAELCQVLHVTGQTVKVAFADQGSPAKNPRGRHSTRGPSFKRSNFLRHKRAPFCCLVARSLNVASGGSTDSGD
ncbi:hypothetical protein LMG29542_08370 [Paraburkholderia humisilvae]|uniref:Transposase IS4-like domain-containing protein n=1 Tax=Paraburkholderia humisilvae TaxID=627669 RepID=A0A6J5F7U1_9BURK|nr:hypothetical protein LMG29542_08370 [Paraburkholderia humisilvae]